MKYVKYITEIDKKVLRMNLVLPLSSIFNKISEDWPEKWNLIIAAIFRKQQKSSKNSYLSLIRCSQKSMLRKKDHRSRSECLTFSKRAIY